MATTAPGVKAVLEYEAMDEVNDQAISQFLVRDPLGLLGSHA
jgi:hypothetical protein